LLLPGVADRPGNQHSICPVAAVRNLRIRRTDLAEAFYGLRPDRRKSYAINLNASRKPETRISRIVQFCGKILAGKDAIERRSL
jgi:hypothetical protein